MLFSCRTIRFIRFILYNLFYTLEAIHTESFFNLRAEKQQHIINAALILFGRNGYKKASVADIAAEAGIAKGMVIYYFGSKKNLYLYLTQMCVKLLTEENERSSVREVTDFFDRIRMAAGVKIALMKQYPAIASFLTSVYYETDPEVADDLKKIRGAGASYRDGVALDRTDRSKFKDDVDPQLLEKFLVWASEGWANDVFANAGVDEMDAFTGQFYEILDLMKRHLYKEES